MPYDFVTLDVFTDRMFGGNPLAVLPDARGLDAGQMQAIAREFNYSETTFVFPPDNEDHTRKVRIFTPLAEIPWAGHPNVGTAVALAQLGEIGEAVAGQRILFEEAPGAVSVFLRGNGGDITSAEFIAPVINGFDGEIPADEAAAALGVKPSRVVSTRHAPTIMALGLRFLYVELESVEALTASEAAPGPVTRISAARGLDGVFAYAAIPGAGEGDIDFRARVYAPVHGVMEDPASGSASAGLGNILASLDDSENATLQWSIEQGVEMGRPSRLDVTAERRAGKVAEIRVSGGAVVACRGKIEVPRAG